MIILQVQFVYIVNNGKAVEGDSFQQLIFVSEHLFLSVHNDKKDVKERCPIMEAPKNHRDERVTIFVEELVRQDHFLRAIEISWNRRTRFLHTYIFEEIVDEIV